MHALILILEVPTSIPTDTAHRPLQGLPTGPFDVEIVTEIKPQDNSLLEGLYKSSGNFCTQVMIGATLQELSSGTSE